MRESVQREMNAQCHNYVPLPVRAREEAHRRWLLLSIAGLILLSTSPVFGHHLASRGEVLLAGRDHLFGVCLIALHLLLEPVHFASHLLIFGGIVYAVWDRSRAWHSLRVTLRGLESRRPSLSTALADVAGLAGVDVSRIRVVEGLPNPAFTAGWFNPRIFLDAELVELLTRDELAAVLAHEGAHAVRRDPLRLSALRFLACTLFFLPALRRLAADAADESEIAADDAAARLASVGAPLALASAIVRIASEWGAQRTSPLGVPGIANGIVGFQRADLLDRRVRRLIGQDTIVGTHLTRRSLVGAGSMLTLIWLSGLMMAHPLPPGVEDLPIIGKAAPALTQRSAERPIHCAHHLYALSHLFCLGAHRGSPGAPCTHGMVSLRT